MELGLKIIKAKNLHGQILPQMFGRTKGQVYIWSNQQTGGEEIPAFPGKYTNNMNRATCPFYTTIPRGDYNGADASCGEAINKCASLVLGGRTNWYLPSQKEMLMAYLDGIFNKAGTTLANAAAFVADNFAWSSSQRINGTMEMYVDMRTGDSSAARNTYNAVHCVSRD